jgi:hypothetical protein
MSTKQIFIFIELFCIKELIICGIPIIIGIVIEAIPCWPLKRIGPKHTT